MRKVLTATALALVGVSVLGTVPAPTVQASSHREAPLISKDPLADNTDVYAFVSPDAPTTVTLIANFIPLEEPASGPNFWKFDDNVLYEIKIDNNADAREDITYQFRFTTQISNPNTFLYNTGQITSLDDPDWNVKQFMAVTEVRGTQSTSLGSNLRTPPVNVGPVSTPNYEALAASAVNTVQNNVKVFAGQRDEGFYVDLGAIFDLGQLRPHLPLYKPAPRAAQPGVDATAGFNVHTIAIQIPISRLTRNGSTPTAPTDPNAVIGVWSTASRESVSVIRKNGDPKTSGKFRQVSRLGMPLVNEVVIPLGRKDAFNASEPSDDAQFLNFVTDPELARLFTLLYGLNVPTPPRNDLVAVFLTGVQGLNQPAGVTPSEMMRLNVAIPPNPNPNRLGVIAGDIAGYPNGRRVGDDTVDISLRVVAGVLVDGFNVSPNNALTDGVDGNDLPYLSTFPYLGTPTSGYNSPHGQTGGRFTDTD